MRCSRVGRAEINADGRHVVSHGFCSSPDNKVLQDADTVPALISSCCKTKNVSQPALLLVCCRWDRKVPERRSSRTLC